MLLRAGGLTFILDSSRTRGPELVLREILREKETGCKTDQGRLCGQEGQDQSEMDRIPIG